MFLIETHTDQKARIREWFQQCCPSVTAPQMLLAFDYMINYGYSIEVACSLAMESYKVYSPKIRTVK